MIFRITKNFHQNEWKLNLDLVIEILSFVCNFKFEYFSINNFDF